MILGIIVLALFEAFILNYVYKAWIKPWIVARADWEHEPGPDYAVSSREMMRRSAWRYDSWTDRIMSLIGFLLVNGLIVFAAIGR